MRHLVLMLFLLFFYLVSAVCCGIFVIGPILARVPDKKINMLIFSWAVLFCLCCVAQYYGVRFIENSPLSIGRQVSPTGFFVIALVTGLLQRQRAKRFPRPEK